MVEPRSIDSCVLIKGVDIVVATPGRLLDHVGQRSIDLSKIEILILDEADRMLDMGFREDMEIILGDMNEERQALFFSATMNRGVMKAHASFGFSTTCCDFQV